MLPDGVLGHILGFLLAPEAVRTCVLARRWRHLWKSATRLRIGCCWDDIATPVEEHREFVDNLLLSRGGLPLDTCEFNFGPVQRNDAPRVNSWLRYAITCKARVIILDVQPEGTEPPIPSALLRLDDQLLVSRHLTRLELVFLDLCNSSFIDFSNCSSLEHLVLEYCEITSAKKISSDSLKYLSLITCHIRASAPGQPRIRISVPNLVSLNISDIEGRTPILDSMPSLVNAFVGITCNCDDICNKLVDPTSFHCGCEFCVTSGNIGHDYRHSVLLKGLSEARNLDLISAPEMFIFKWDLRWLPIFSNLETLLLNEYFCMSDDLSALTCILEHSPLLKKLTLELFSQSYKYKVEMKGSFSLMERPATISEHLKIVEVKCQAVDDRVLKVLKFLCTFNIHFRF